MGAVPGKCRFCGSTNIGAGYVLGYSMENLVQLAERREAVYTKALAGRAVYLSPRAFRLLAA